MNLENDARQKNKKYDLLIQTENLAWTATLEIVEKKKPTTETLIIVTGFVPRLWVMTLWKIFAVDTQFKQLRKRSLQKIQASAGYNIAQLVEHCTGIAEVTGSYPAEAWIFFRLLFRNCLNCVSTAKIFHNVRNSDGW